MTEKRVLLDGDAPGDRIQQSIIEHHSVGDVEATSRAPRTGGPELVSALGIKLTMDAHARDRVDLSMQPPSGSVTQGTQ